MRYIQLAGDALIPLLGFFWWNWSVYFIVLFYLLDLLIGEVIIYFKARKIAEYDQREKAFYGRFLLSLLLLTGSVFLIHIAIWLFYPGIDFIKEMVAFWEYEDMGFQQGYILLPLLILIAYQRYKLEFLLPARYRNTRQLDLWNNHFRAYLILIGLVGFAILISYGITLPDIALLFGIIIGTTSYQLYLPE